MESGLRAQLLLLENCSHKFEACTYLPDLDSRDSEVSRWIDTPLSNEGPIDAAFCPNCI